MHILHLLTRKKGNGLRMQYQSLFRRSILLLLALTIAVEMFGQAFSVDVAHAASISSFHMLTLSPSSNNWTTYLGDNWRTGFNTAQYAFTPANVAHLKIKWSQYAAGSVSVEPVVANNVVYWGSWDGYEHAFTSAGVHLWDSQIGRTSDSDCSPSTVGVSSTAAIGRIGSTPALFVGGGNGSFYALSAATGAVIWSRRLGSSPSHFLWSSPLLVGGHVYIGVASFGDCPLVQGQLVQLNASTGAVEHTFNVVPPGCEGGTVWGSPTLGESGKVIYIATGNPGSCSKPEPYATAIVELGIPTLSVIGSWRVPVNEQSGDKDFGSTPTIFNAYGGSTRHYYVGVAHKNGMYYVFDRLHMNAGPVWQVKIANDRSDCPQCGDGSISPSAWDGTALYVAGGATTISGTSCKGSVRALDPFTGAFLWQHCLQKGPVLGAVTAIPGMVMVSQGNEFDMLSAKTGRTLFTYSDTRRGAIFYSGAAVANGIVFQGSMDGYLYAFSL
jgi:outer membrane protein assembly factor BamB